MLTRIALVAPPGHAQKKLRALLSRPLAYVVREFHTMEEVQAGLSQFSFQVLIIRIPAFEVEHVQMIRKLRATYPNSSLVTISPLIDPRARFELRAIAQHTLLDEDLEIDDLQSVIHRSAQVKHLNPHRLHPRTKREGKAVLVFKNDDQETSVIVDAKFLDFARMGARVLVETDQLLGHQLEPKTRVELRYRSSEDGGALHRIETRLVWAETSENPLHSLLNAVLKKTKAELGLRFIAQL